MWGDLQNILKYSAAGHPERGARGGACRPEGGDRTDGSY
jgi:hypothetical protein